MEWFIFIVVIIIFVLAIWWYFGGQKHDFIGLKNLDPPQREDSPTVCTVDEEVNVKSTSKRKTASSERIYSQDVMKSLIPIKVESILPGVTAIPKVEEIVDISLISDKELGIKLPSLSVGYYNFDESKVKKKGSKSMGESRGESLCRKV